MKRVESKKWLGNNQTGSRKTFSAVETAIINKVMVKTHRLTNFPLCTHQDGAMRFYGRIIRSHTILNSRNFGITDNTCKFYSIAHDIIKFRTQINDTISKKSYSSTKKLTYH